MAPGALVWAALGVLAGVMIAFQAPINAQLARSLGTPVAAATVSFGAGAIALLLTSAAIHGPGVADLPWRATPAWLFVAGGCMGAAYVTTAIVLTPRLGVAALTGFSLAGQLIAGIVIDHLGLFGLAVREVSVGRLTGAALLVAGAVLLRLA